MNTELSLCTNQVLRFFRYLDERRYDALAALLSDDAVWHRQGRELAGPAKVLDALAQRSATLRIVHIMANLMAEELDADRCVMQAYMLVVRHEPGCELAAPAPLDGIESIRTMHVALRRDGSQWLITELKGDGILFANNA